MLRQGLRGKAERSHGHHSGHSVHSRQQQLPQFNLLRDGRLLHLRNQVPSHALRHQITRKPARRKISTHGEMAGDGFS